MLDKNDIVFCLGLANYCENEKNTIKIENTTRVLVDQ